MSAPQTWNHASNAAPQHIGQAILAEPAHGATIRDIPGSLSSYCDAPHLTPEGYTPPQVDGPHSDKARLVHVIHVQRHHKRTLDNLVPNNEAAYSPPEGWQCDDVELKDGIMVSNISAQIKRMYNVPQWNPVHERIWNGTCDAGQLTSEGYRDTYHHGRDLAKVYGRNGVQPLLSTDGLALQDEILFRTSPEERTQHVAGGLLQGMGFPHGHAFPAIVMPSAIDGIVPSYTCTFANKLLREIEEENLWKEHLAMQEPLFDQVNAVLGTGNHPAWNSWIDRPFDYLSSRQCHNHGLPRNASSGATITQEMADRIYAEGDWEYDYIFDKSPQADNYVKYSFAVFVKELIVLLQHVKHGKSRHKLSLFVGHDGTMARLSKTLGRDGISWPGMGSEIQIEAYSTGDPGAAHDSRDFHVRLLAQGETMVTHGNYSQRTVQSEQKQSSAAEWIPLDTFLTYLESRIPDDLQEKCAI